MNSATKMYRICKQYRMTQLPQNARIFGGKSYEIGIQFGIAEQVRMNLRMYENTEADINQMAPIRLTI